MSVSDNTIWNGFPRRWVLRSSIDPTGIELIALMGYRQLSPPEDTTAQCHILLQQRAIALYERIFVHNGLALEMTVRRTAVADLPSRDQTSLMQFPSQGVGERLTDDSVAHGHRPPDPICNPSCADDVGSHDFRSQQQSASSNAHPFSVDSSSSDGPFLHAPSGVADAQALQCHGGPGSLAVVWFLEWTCKAPLS